MAKPVRILSRGAWSRARSEAPCVNSPTQSQLPLAYPMPGEVGLTSSGGEVPLSRLPCDDLVGAPKPISRMMRSASRGSGGLGLRSWRRGSLGRSPVEARSHPSGACPSEGGSGLLLVTLPAPVGPVIDVEKAGGAYGSANGW
jgi:hypothetical protein